MQTKKILIVSEESDELLEGAVQATLLSMGVSADKLNLSVRRYGRIIGDRGGSSILDDYCYALVLYSHTFDKMTQRLDYKFEHQRSLFIHGILTARMGEENIGVICRPLADSYSSGKNFRADVDAESMWQLKLLNKLKSLDFQIDAEKFVALAGRVS